MFTQPVIGNDFFGRIDILETLNKRVSALASGYRQNIALSGQMMSGKSSILHHFIKNIDNRSVVPIYVEVKDKSFEAFADKFMATVLYAFFESESHPCSATDLDALIEEGEKVLPETTNAIKKIRDYISKKKYNMAYRDLLEITSRLKDETQKHCIVILDEFHNLSI